jgi:hypothetical protein
MAHFIYCDEQDDDRLRFSAAIACIFNEADIPKYREAIIHGLRDVFDRKATAMPLPELHACNLPRDLTDLKKITLFSMIISAVSECASGIYRMGYSWDDDHQKNFEVISGAKNKKAEIRAAAYSTMQHELSQLSVDRLVFVQELDIQNLASQKDFMNRTTNLEQLTQLKLLGHTFDNHLSRSIGYYFCPKRDYMAYGVDFVAYLLKLQAKRERTLFQDQIVEACPNLEPLILRNEILPPRKVEARKV